jgi:hypothetical protein
LNPNEPFGVECSHYHEDFVQKARLLIVATLALLIGTVALAHEEHCHVKDASGNWTDAKDATTKVACDAKGGVWKHHHFHCHKAGADGKMADFPGGKDKKSCVAQGGQWTDHGHEAE